MTREGVKHAKRSGSRREVVTVERTVHGGVALARTGSGEVALVAGALPGETVEAELRRERGVWQGRSLGVVVASPDRVPAHAHPGLDFSFMTYERQLIEKRAVVVDALARARAPLPAATDVDQVVPAPADWGYRNTVQPAAARGGLGYRRPASHEVVVLDEDPTATAAVNAAWSAVTELGGHRGAGVREVAIRANDAGEALVALVSDAPERALLDFAHALVRGGVTGVSYAPHDARGRFRSGATRLAGERFVRQRYGRVTLTVNATSFAQPNARAAGALYEELARWAGDGGTAVELYAGGGAIAFHLAERFGRVLAVEIDRAAVARGLRDLERLGIGNVEFVRQDARAVAVPAGAELVVVDPPRAGLSADARAAIAAGSAARLIYVSCDPATWARDVADLARRGLVLERAVPYDFYPQTHHVELLSLLTRA